MRRLVELERPDGRDHPARAGRPPTARGGLPPRVRARTVPLRSPARRAGSGAFANFAQRGGRRARSGSLKSGLRDGPRGAGFCSSRREQSSRTSEAKRRSDGRSSSGAPRLRRLRRRGLRPQRGGRSSLHNVAHYFLNRCARARRVGRARPWADERVARPRADFEPGGTFTMPAETSTILALTSPSRRP